MLGIFTGLEAPVFSLVGTDPVVSKSRQRGGALLFSGGTTVLADPQREGAAVSLPLWPCSLPVTQQEELGSQGRDEASVSSSEFDIILP